MSLDNSNLSTSPAPRPTIADITPYTPGKSTVEGVSDPVKLSANENILGCSPAAKAAYLEAAGDLAAYPDGRGARLRGAIAKRYRLEEHRIILGTGSDEIFGLLSQVFLGAGDNIVQGEYGFGAYAIAARANEAEVRLAPEPRHRIDVDAMLGQVDDRTRLVWVANPANPTGTFLSDAEVRRLHDGLPPNVVLVLDGAYAEFVDDPTYSDGLDLARGAANVVVTRTFSKLHGLAALRVGWAYAPEAISDAVNRIRPPFNTSIAGQAAAVAALADEGFQAVALAHVVYWRPWLTQQLGGLGLEVIPSAANFVLVGFEDKDGIRADDAEAFLAHHGLIVRGVAGYGLPNHLRITIGLEEHNRAVVEALAAFLQAGRRSFGGLPSGRPDKMKTPIYERLAIIGGGLIGSSIARAARVASAVGEVNIADASATVRARLRALGIADRITTDPGEACRGADLVVFATPPLAIGPAALIAANDFQAGATITDVGSVKAVVAAELTRVCPTDVFVIPGHPISGSENSGPDAGYAELFQGRWTILTPQPRDDADYRRAVDRLSDFWRALGAQVELMDGRHHDLVLAVTSHLPHLIAYNIVGTAADLEEVTRSEVIKYSAGGFRDFTRIAASDPVMWRDVFLANKDAVLEILGRFTEDLQALSRAIRWEKGDKLEELFTRTRAIRRGVVAAGQETAEPDFGRRAHLKE